jgi:hypothetical protein
MFIAEPANLHDRSLHFTLDQTKREVWMANNVIQGATRASNANFACLELMIVNFRFAVTFKDTSLEQTGLTRDAARRFQKCLSTLARHRASKLSRISRCPRL